jgi:methylase of polypeptide subunit release factors
MELKEFKLKNINVYTADQLDGYGLLTVQDFVSIITSFYNDRKFENVLEWCSGPGYFGLMLYDFGIAETVLLSDIHEPLALIVQKTIDNNSLDGNVRFIMSDNFKNIDEKFDLIIGNPPHFNFELEYNQETIHYQEHRKFVDRHWKIHEDFFANAADHLENDGEIVLMENCKGSNKFTFKSMIEKNHLKIVDVRISQQFPNDTWYIRIKKA